MAYTDAVGLTANPASSVTLLYSSSRRISWNGTRAVCASPPTLWSTRLALSNDGSSLRSSVTSSSTVSWRKELLKDGGVRGLRTREAFCVRAASDDSDVKTDKGPSWAKPDSGELPPWARNERPASQEPTQRFSFAVYLVGSAIVAIAAIGSIFEYSNRNPIFGVVYPDNALWAPILGFFAITGLPVAGFLFYKSITLANKASEDADKEDGFNR